MRRSTFLLAAVLAVTVALVSACATDPSTGPKTFDESGLQVVKRGDRGSPLIFIPGLSSGAWTWDAIADRYARNHVVYLVTLPGFDGMPPAGPAPLATAEAAIAALIDHQHLDRPVLIGHAFGGTMAIHLAETLPGKLGGIVAVDGLPVFPRSENLTPAQRPAYAARVKAAIPIDPAAYAAAQENYMNSAGGVIDPIVAKQLAAKSGRSDPASVANYLQDDLAADFRPDLGKITVPVLVISPYNPIDFTYQGQTLAEADKTAYYEGLMKGTPKLKVISISPARHFVMFDQPDKLEAAIDAFIMALPKR